MDKATVEGLLYTHDRIAGLKMDSGPQFVLEDDALLRRLGNYSEPNIKGGRNAYGIINNAFMAATRKRF